MYREISTCCYTFVEHETFSVKISRYLLLVMYGIKVAKSAQHHMLSLHFQSLSYMISLVLMTTFTLKYNN